MKNKLLISMLTTLLASCSTHNLSTNLDKKNFINYFSASKVDIYKNEIEFNEPYKYLGLVEGQSCQIKPHHASPDKIIARSQARKNAFEKQANAIIFSNCAMLTQEQLTQLNNSNDAQQCHAIIICYARAYFIENKS